jgi:predicted AlkP superfamily phosphohydrolase/phosphomutase
MRVARVVAIGLDAADWQLLESRMDRGDLPNLARLRAGGARCVLRNDALYRTSLVWEAFLTGRVDPASEFSAALAFDPARYAPFKVGARTDPTFFARSPGVRSVVFDAPYLSLAGAGDGDVRVCGWGAHVRSYPRAAHPAGLLSDIDATFGPHPSQGLDHRHAWYRPAQLDTLADALAAGARRRVDVSGWLARRFPDHDLLVTVLSETHSAVESLGLRLTDDHPLARVPTADQANVRLHEVYRAVDDAVGRIVAAQGDETLVVVFSLHGAKPNEGDLPSTVLLPELLHRLHFGRPHLRQPDAAAWARQGHPPVVPDTDADWAAYMRAQLPRERRRRAADVAARVRSRLVPGSRQARFPGEDRRSPDEIGVPRWPVDDQVGCWYRQAWPRMRAFALPTFSDGRVRVNVAGRERHGTVPADDYGRVCDEVESWLRECRDPRTGRPAVVRVTRPRAGDPLAPDGSDADLVVEWAEAVDALDHPEVGVVGPFPFRRSASHSPRGFMLAAGPGVVRADYGERPARDLAPTILALLGRAVPAGVEGEPILAAVPTAR